MVNLFITDEDLPMAINGCKKHALNESDEFIHTMVLSICNSYIASGSLSEKQRDVIARYFHTTVKGFTRRTIGVKSQEYKEMEQELDIWKDRAYEYKEKYLQCCG